MTRESIKHGIEPVYNSESEILILGTMPSPKSREVGFYYAHPQNRFWRVISALFDEPLFPTKEQRADQLLRHRIALWDVLASCELEGASDTSIRNAVPNDVSRITQTAPIKAVFCTGAKAAQLYRTLCQQDAGLPCVQLPSTSPANAAWSEERLVDAYREILPYLSCPKPPTLSVEDTVKLEQSIAQRGTSLAELMDRAGLWLAYQAHKLCPQGRISVMCGSGNNGGDGWVAARHLAAWKHEVVLITPRNPEELRAQPAHDAANAAAKTGSFQMLVSPDEHTVEHVFNTSDLIIDALLGTGFSGQTVKEPYASWIQLANASKTDIVAADVPSGLNANDATPAASTIRAKETVCMICGKQGLYLPAAAQYCGRISIAPLVCLKKQVNGSRRRVILAGGEQQETDSE